MTSTAERHMAILVSKMSFDSAHNIHKPSQCHHGTKRSCTRANTLIDCTSIVVYIAATRRCQLSSFGFLTSWEKPEQHWMRCLPVRPQRPTCAQRKKIVPNPSKYPENRTVMDGFDNFQSAKTGFGFGSVKTAQNRSKPDLDGFERNRFQSLSPADTRTCTSGRRRC